MAPLFLWRILKAAIACCFRDTAVKLQYTVVIDKAEVARLAMKPGRTVLLSGSANNDQGT